MFFESFIRCKLGNAINTSVYSIYKSGQIPNISPSPIILQVFVKNVFERSNIALSKCRLGLVFGCRQINLLLFTKLFEFTFELGSLVCPNLYLFFLIDHLFERFDSVFAYKAFIGCTLRYRDKTSTATSKYLTPLLCCATLSIYATSTDQISFILYATAFSLGKLFLNCSYFVYGAFDWRYWTTLDLGKPLVFFKLAMLPKAALPFVYNFFNCLTWEEVICPQARRLDFGFCIFKASFIVARSFWFFCSRDSWFFVFWFLLKQL